VYFYVGLVMYAHLWLWGLLVGSWTHMAQLLESYWNDPTPFYLALRWLSVVCGVATIGVVAALGKTLSGNRTAWLAAGLMATNYLVIRNSHFGTIDSLWTLAISVALWTMLHWAKHLPERPVLLTESLATSPKPYAVPKWVLAAVGVAIGVKYPAAVLLVPVWWIACTPLITPSLIHWGALFKTIGQISLVVLGVFLLTSPWTVLDMHQFLADVAYESSYYYTYRLRGIDPGWLFYPKLALWHGVGAGLLACAAWGVWQTRKINSQAHARGALRVWPGLFCAVFGAKCAGNDPLCPAVNTGRPGLCRPGHRGVGAVVWYPVTVDQRTTAVGGGRGFGEYPDVALVKQRGGDGSVIVAA
jgi:4-amino-4-deoxy-L-arabinose transferase-like glycosyltransferase